MYLAFSKVGIFPVAVKTVEHVILVNICFEVLFDIPLVAFCCVALLLFLYELPIALELLRNCFTVLP